MIEDIGKNLVQLKQEFRDIYSGTSHIQEVIPLLKSDSFPIDQNELDLLHLFVTKNPIYYNSYQQKINDIECMVYEGDINKYWLNSITHGSSYQPFSPTWVLSAYVIASLAKTLNYKEVLDIGSGDGRIAYCAKILGLSAYGIEIDDMLVDLQKSLCDFTKIDWKGKNVLIFGSEGSGIKKHTEKYADFNVKIIINKKVESLNISNSASIVFHHIKKKKIS